MSGRAPSNLVRCLLGGLSVFRGVFLDLPLGPFPGTGVWLAALLDGLSIFRPFLLDVSLDLFPDTGVGLEFWR